MPAELLTAKSLESKLKEAARAAAAKNTRIAIGDGNNLMLIVRPNGSASWVLKYRLNGRRTMHALGPWPTVGLAHARKLADSARRGVVDGRDPVEARREARRQADAAAAAARGQNTVRALYLSWTGAQNWAENYASTLHNAFTKDVLPEIGLKPVTDVTRDDILKILRNIESRSSLVRLRKVRQWLGQMFEFELGREGAPLHSSPVPRKLVSFRKPVRGHFPAITDPAEVPALMRRIREWHRPIVRMALLLSAYTFQRPTEVREAAWGEFDLKAAKWVIPAERMKGKAEHWVPLAPQVVDMLRRHQAAFGDAGALFPGRKDGRPISEATVNKALRTWGYEGRHCTHGFRAMARTIGDEVLKIDPRFLEAQLAHEQDESGLNGAYNRAKFWDDRVKMMAAWADWLDAQTAER